MPVSFSWPSFGANRRKRALKRAGETLADDAKSRSPDDTGAMDRSVRVELLDADSVRVSFNTAYAKRQHYSKKNKHDDGSAFFLLDATRAVGPQIEQILADEIRRGMSG